MTDSAAQRTAAGAAAPTAGNSAQDTPDATAAAGSAAPALTPLGPGMCCPDGKCLCRAQPPASLSMSSSGPGPHASMQYAIEGLGCVFYPTDPPPPYAAVAIADGFGGSGGCDSVQTQEWGPLYASHGILSMIIETGTGDQASARGEALLAAIAAFKAENEKSESPLFGKLAGRYGTSGFVYGEIDPWTAGAFEIDPSRDLHAFIVPGASHGANLGARSLPAESRALALEVLERWTGVKPRALTAEEQALQAQSQELYFHLPAQRMRL